MQTDSPLKPRNLWSSRFAFVMVTCGAAVGLGNIWKFPYMAGTNGGGVFVLMYLLLVFLIGVPTMLAELMLGRLGRQNPVNTLNQLAQKFHHSKHWQSLGWLGALTLLMVLSFYSVVAGWSIAYLVHAFEGMFSHISPEKIMTLWDTLLASPSALILWHSIFMILTMGVIALGVNKGIEQASKWMMPGLFLILILLLVFSALNGNFKEAALFLFSFRWEDFTAKALIDALGQAFFSLATGAGAILIYGSYLNSKTNLVNTVLIITVLDVLVAILAGLAIFPLVFAHGLAPSAGPGLMFQALPIAFNQLPFSNLIAGSFFVLLLFAAWTSSISMGEPLVALLQERKNLSRNKASLIVGMMSWTLGLACVFSFNIWKDVKIGRWGIFDILTDLPTNILLPMGAFFFCVFTAWKLPKSVTAQELNARPWVFHSWHFILKYIAPIGILVVFIANLLGWHS